VTGLVKKEKKEKKEVNRVYEYTPLASTSLGATSLYNLYGVVIDAHMPRMCEKLGNKYRQQVRIIDQSMHYKNVEGAHYQKGQNQPPKDINNCAITINFMAKTPDQLPNIKRVGEIIRVHRANIGQYKNYKIFNANIDYGTSWVVYKGAEEQEEPQVNHQNSEAEKNIKNFFGQAGEEERQILDHKVDMSIKPYQSSGPGFNLAPIDQEYVK
jgi:hypothetical protein